MIALVFAVFLLSQLSLALNCSSGQYVTNHFAQTLHTEYATALATFNRVVPDSIGNYFVFGTFSSSITLGGQTISAIGGVDAFIAKYYSNTTLQWVIMLGGSGTETPGNLELDERQQILYASFYTTSPFISTITPAIPTGASSRAQILLQVSMTTPTIVWNATAYLSANANFPSYVLVDKSTFDVFWVATFSTSIIFDTYSISSSFGSIFSRIASNRTRLFTTLVPGSCQPAGIVFDAVSNVVIAGKSLGMCVATQSRATGASILYQSTGSSSTMRGVIAGTDAIYLAVSFSTPVFSFSFSNMSTSTAASTASLIIKYSYQTGAVLWFKQIENTVGGVSMVQGITISENNQYLYFTGYFTNTMTLDQVSLVPNGGQDIFIGSLFVSSPPVLKYMRKIGSSFADNGVAIQVKNSIIYLSTITQGAGITYDGIPVIAYIYSSPVLAIMAETCQGCPIGTYSSSVAAELANCVPCPLSTYANIVGSASCSSCPGGMTTYSLGSTICTACATPGTFTNISFDAVKILYNGASVVVSDTEYAGVAADTYANNVFAFGTTNIPLLQIDGISHSLSLAGYIVKFQSNFAIAFVKTIRTTFSVPIAISNVVTDTNGTIYFAATIISAGGIQNVMIDSTSKLNYGGYDVVLASLKPDGSVNFLNVFGSPGDDRASDLVADGNFLYMVGRFSSTAVFGRVNVTSNGITDFFVAKLSRNSTIIWMVTGGGLQDDYANRVAVDLHGNVYVTGSCKNNITIGSTLSTSISNDIFVAKFASNGTLNWIRRFATTPAVTIRGVAVDSSGQTIVIGGSFSVSLTMDSITVVSAGQQDSYVAKLNSTGQVQALYRGGGTQDEKVASVKIDAMGNTYLLGSFAGNATFGNVTASSNGNEDVFLVQYTANGTALYARSFGGTGNDVPYIMSLDIFGNVLMAGKFGGNINFDALQTFSTQSLYDLFVVRMTLACTQCKAGTYSNTPLSLGIQPCQSCLAGKYGSTPGSQTDADCKDCIPGSYSNGGVQFCTLCSAGYFNPYTSQSSQSSCIACGMGSFSSQAGAMACQQCFAGSYSPMLNATSCISCPVGTFNRITGAKNVTECAPCPLGQYSSSTAATSCLLCPAGSYTSVVGQSDCAVCPPGTYSSTIGATNVSQCLFCPAGSYSSISGARGVDYCNLCPVGTYSAVVGASSSSTCTPCISGTYGTILGAPSNATCTPCAAGFFSNVIGASSISTCSACSSGTYSPSVGATGSSSCIPCIAGTFSAMLAANSVSTCVTCPQGSFSSILGATSSSSCSLCPAGTFSSVTGATSSSTCTPCNAGTFSGSVGATSISSCIACASGTYSITIGAASVTSCIACPAGSYSSLLGASGISSCLSCPAGTFSSVSGANSITACISCSIGYYSSFIGASSDTTCVPCPRGYFATTIGTSAAVCNPCGAGYFSNSTGASSASACKPCQMGTYLSTTGGASESSCLPCPVGTFQNATGSQLCNSCPIGTSNNKIGGNSETACQKCSLGTFSNSAGASTCTPCAAGSYASPNSSESCNLCPAGSYSSGSGATSITSCIACGVGTYSATIGADTAAACVPCPQGTSSIVVGATSVAVCQLCPIGTFGSNGLCVNCSVGTYGVKSGATSILDCLSCVAGTYSDVVGVSLASSCKECPIGTYAPSIKSKYCIPCEYGKFINKTGADSCIACETKSHCAVGTSYPSPSLLSNSSSSSADPYFIAQAVKESQNAKDSQDGRIATIVVFVLLSVFVAVGCIALLLLLYKYNKGAIVFAIMKALDLFALKHFVKPNDPIVKKSTILGGIFTLVYLCIVLAVFILLLIDLSKSNIRVISSIIPQQVIPKEYPQTVVGNFSVLVTLLNYNAENCAPSQSIVAVGFDTQEGFYTWYKKTNSSCTVAWTCSNCKLNGASQSVSFDWDYAFAMASAIEYNISLPNFYNELTPSFIFERLNPQSSDTFFRGTESTIVSLSLLKAYFSPLANDYLIGNIVSKATTSSLVRVGYVATSYPTRAGSQTTSDQFVTAPLGLHIKLQMTVDANVFVIVEQAQSTLLEFLSRLVALVGAVGGLVALVMALLEQLALAIQEKRAKTKEQQKQVEMVQTTNETVVPASQ